MKEDGTYEQLPKKETVQLEKERARALEKYIGGLKGGMGAVPGARCSSSTRRKRPSPCKKPAKLRVPIVSDHRHELRSGSPLWSITSSPATTTRSARCASLITGAIAADACVAGYSAHAAASSSNSATGRQCNQNDGYRQGGRPGNDAFSGRLRRWAWQPWRFGLYELRGNNMALA